VSAELETAAAWDVYVASETDSVPMVTHERQFGLAGSVELPMAAAADGNQIADVSRPRRLEPDGKDVMGVQSTAA
jgi:hypothetical protein